MKKYLWSLFTALLLMAVVYQTRSSLKISPKSHFSGREEKSVAEMYDRDDLGACSLFAGNFINFGFWESVPKDRQITLSERVESEKNLYRFVAKHLKIDTSDRVLEVACGQGVGSALLLNELSVKEIHGIDLSEAQILRAKKIHSEAIKANPGKLFFEQGLAEKIPYGSHSFEKIFSIEAAQHFENLDLFGREANRVLKPGGKLAIASFFGTSDNSHQLLSSMIQTIKAGIDKATPIQQLENTLKQSGFKNIQIKNIGENVWEGFDQWASQTDLKRSWSRNWYQGYKRGLIDYYLVTAEK